MTSMTKNTEATQPQLINVDKTRPIRIFKSPFNHGDYCVVRNNDELKQLCEEINCDEKVFSRLTTQEAQTVWITSDEAGSTLSVIRMNLILNEESRFQCVSTLLHECVHVAQNIFESMGEKEPSREFQAYLINQIFDNVGVEYFRDDSVFQKCFVSDGEAV